MLHNSYSFRQKTLLILLSDAPAILVQVPSDICRICGRMPSSSLQVIMKSFSTELSSAGHLLPSHVAVNGRLRGNKTSVIFVVQTVNRTCRSQKS